MKINFKNDETFVNYVKAMDSIEWMIENVMTSDDWDDDDYNPYLEIYEDVCISFASYVTSKILDPDDKLFPALVKVLEEAASNGDFTSESLNW